MKHLSKMLEGIALLRQLDPEMPAQTAMTFLIIATTPGITVKQLMERLDVVSSTATRNVATLSKWQKFQKAGHDLIESEPDPKDRRWRRLTLNAKGKKLAEAINKALE